MKRLERNPFNLLLLLLISLPFSACKKEELNEMPEPAEEMLFDVEIGDSEIPYIQVTTNGVEIQNEPKIPAKLKIFVDKEEVQSATIGIEYRGSTSFRLSDKKSFGVETWDLQGNDVDVSFFGFPAEEDWILNGHVVNLEEGYIFDRTLMYHYFGYQVYQNMGRYGSRSKFVELEVNGKYQGVYVFMEKLKRDGERIDIASLRPSDEDAAAITGGYILKIDKTAGGDVAAGQPLEYFENNWADDARYTLENSFRSQYDINGDVLSFDPYGPPYHPEQYLETYFLYEYPKAEEITPAQKTYIQDYIHQFETALLTDDFSTETRTYPDFIDLSSFVDYFIINELCRNVDGYRLSTYISKDRGGKLKMGPIWDLNIGYDSGDRVPVNDWVINYNQFVDRDPWMMPFWWPRLLEDPIFREAVKQRWTDLRGGVLSSEELLGLVNQTAGYLQDNGAINRNYEKWNIGSPVDYEGAVQNLRSFLERRTEWMDQTIASF